MQEKIIVKEAESAINQHADIDIEIINTKLLEGEDDINNDRVHSAIEVFKGLRQRFGY